MVRKYREGGKDRGTKWREGQGEDTVDGVREGGGREGLEGWSEDKG